MYHRGLQPSTPPLTLKHISILSRLSGIRVLLADLVQCRGKMGVQCSCAQAKASSYTVLVGSKAGVNLMLRVKVIRPRGHHAAPSFFMSQKIHPESFQIHKLDSSQQVCISPDSCLLHLRAHRKFYRTHRKFYFLGLADCC